MRRGGLAQGAIHQVEPRATIRRYDPRPPIITVEPFFFLINLLGESSNVLIRLLLF